ncbi:MAG: RNase adapter RapZ [Paracoccus sp. (in: a-proteobacteria)]|nr:RNase adapter RapZ [Paracoccus sp. (in: a-proteobacteria)]
MTNPPPADPAQQADHSGQRVVLVTGPSGAGRSTAINALEDMGFEAIDNLPLSLIPRLLDGPPRPVPLALGVDVRNRDFTVGALIEMIDRLTRDPRFRVEVLYLDADATTLTRRFSTTKRRHPLAPDMAPLDAVAAEKKLLEPIKARADHLINTSEMSPHDLKAELSVTFAEVGGGQLAVSVQSFSYKRGVPRGIDLVFDCRFLENPHWDEALRPKDGRDPAVQDYVMADARYDEFFQRVRDLILFLLPAHLDEGKAHLAIGFGCTGGKHRSVTLTERMADALLAEGWQVTKRHRELERSADADAAASGAGGSGQAEKTG